MIELHKNISCGTNNALTHTEAHHKGEVDGADGVVFLQTLPTVGAIKMKQLGLCVVQ